MTASELLAQEIALREATKTTLAKALGTTAAVEQSGYRQCCEEIQLLADLKTKIDAL